MGAGSPSHAWIRGIILRLQRPEVEFCLLLDSHGPVPGTVSAVISLGLRVQGPAVLRSLISLWGSLFPWADHGFPTGLLQGPPTPSRHRQQIALIVGTTGLPNQWTSGHLSLLPSVESDVDA